MLLIIQILMKWQKMRAGGTSRPWAVCSLFEGQVSGFGVTALAVEGILGQWALRVSYTGDSVPFHTLLQEPIISFCETVFTGRSHCLIASFF